MAKHELKINNRVGTAAPRGVRPPVAMLEQILLETLKQFGGALAKRPTETSLAFIGDAAMANLNKLYRGKKGTTNVLSFSFVRAPNKIGAGRPLLLGEVLISPAQAAKGARAHKHSTNTEIALLFLHGLLHVISFDHEKGSTGQRKMQQAEDAVIARIPTLSKAAQGRGLIVRELVYPK